jgi:hypothetical protein
MVGTPPARLACTSSVFTSPASVTRQRIALARLVRHRAAVSALDRDPPHSS